MKRVMIQIIWEPVTQRTDTHKTERPELLDDPLQLVGQRYGLLDSGIVPPPGATHKSRSSSGCLGQLVSCRRTMNHLWSCQWMPSIVQLCYNNLGSSAGSRYTIMGCSYLFIQNAKLIREVDVELFRVRQEVFLTARTYSTFSTALWIASLLSFFNF